MKKKDGATSILLEFAAPQMSSYIVSVILAVFGEAMGMLPYFAVARIIVAMMAGQGGILYYLPYCAMAGIGYIGKGVLSGISTATSHRATYLVMRDIRHRVISKLSRLPMGTLLDTPSGHYKDIVVDRVESMEIPLAHLLPEMTANILVPFMMLIYLALLDWRMALATLITLPVGLIIMHTTMGSYTEKYAGSVEASTKMTNAIVEYMGGIEVIKAFNQSARSYRKYTDAVKGNAAYFYNWMKSAQWPMSSYGAIAPTVLLPVLPIGFLLYANGSLSAPNLVTILILSLGVVGPLIVASNYVDNLARVGTVAGQVRQILDAPELIRPTEPVNLYDTTISLNNVDFSYHEDNKSIALRNVNLKFAPDTVNALVGPSGSGKSTIAKLVAGFWDVTDGAIHLGGIDLRSIPQRQLAEHIAYVSQDNYLFDDTIRENIRNGLPGASDAEVEKTAKDAGCDVFIRSLENGYDTIVGSAGGHLSGGERQRIAIARVMLKNAPIVILDEATAYIDPENEAAIQAAVAKLVAGKTLIVIAHRLSTITDADQIIVMDSGAVAATGTHQELLEKSNPYKEMWQAHIGAKDGDE